jgi:hypothetical protein
MKTHHHTLLLTLVISVTLLVVAVYGYMYWAMKVSADRVRAARDIVALERAGQEHEEELRALYETTRLDRVKLQTYFVPADGVVDFIETLESLGPQAGSKVTLSAIDAELPEKEIFGNARARIDVSGSWSAVMKTLTLAENLPYPIYISNVRMDLTAPEGGGGTRVWRLVFVIEAIMASTTDAALNQ